MTARILWMGLLACGPVSPMGDDAGVGATTGGVSTSGAAVTTGVTATGRTTGILGGTSTDSSTDTAGGTSSEPGTTDGDGILRPDLYPETCDPFTQDCPEGYKCAPYAADGGPWWNADKCVLVMEDPAQVHEPCIAAGGGFSGSDNCDVGLLCWDVDPEGQGSCIELCHGSSELGLCYEPGFFCLISADAVNPLCLAGCDPIAQDCDEAFACINNVAGEGFLCTLDASGEEGQQHDTCTYHNACDPGLLCNDPTVATECDPNEIGCCEPFCDLNDPNADANCGGVGQVCNPWYEEGAAPPGYEDVGFCAVPM